MITELISALIKNLIVFLKKEPGFFALSVEQRQQKSEIFADILGNMSEEEFVNDLERTLKYMKGSALVKESHLLHGLATFFTKRFPNIFDQLDRRFYSLSHQEQQEKLSRILPQSGTFYKTLHHILSLYSPQEITEEIVSFLTMVEESPRILVQSPVECKQETKASIRQYFAQSHPHSFVAFGINPQLIGGIRFFMDGKLQDHSWFSKIEGIRRLSRLVS